MTHLNDPRMTEVKHELARIPTLDLNFSHGSLLFVFCVISSVILGYSRITCRKDKLQIAASMQALTLVLVTPVPQGAHRLIRKQVHSDDQSLHPLQRRGFVGQGLSLEPLSPCIFFRTALCYTSLSDRVPQTHTRTYTHTHTHTRTHTHAHARAHTPH